jgi:hypothetical protein
MLELASLEFTYVDRAVSRGATLLDKHMPRWYTYVNLDILDMMSRKYCLLSQLYGTLDNGLQDLNLPTSKACSCGLALEPKLLWMQLTWNSLWKSQILERRNQLAFVAS